jgi:spore coat protein U-like protein
MRTPSLRLCLALGLLCSAPGAQAALSCTAPVSTGFSTAYTAAGVVPNVSQGTVSFNCTRSAATDATSVLLTADNGTHAKGAQNLAVNGKNSIRYEVFMDSACNAVWSSTFPADYWPVNLLNTLGAQSVSVSYWACITLAGQVVGAGTYTDTVLMTVRNDTKKMQPLSSNNSFPVSITSPASFEITVAPADVAFSYTAFGPVVSAGTTFVTTGTLDLPYTMALDAATGVASGLNYSLKIDAQASPVSGKGTGAPQTHTINGSMPGGQAGTCNTGFCFSSQVHTLTITY